VADTHLVARMELSRNEPGGTARSFSHPVGQLTKKAAFTGVAEVSPVYETVDAHEIESDATGTLNPLYRGNSCRDAICKRLELQESGGERGFDPPAQLLTVHDLAIVSPVVPHESPPEVTSFGSFGTHCSGHPPEAPNTLTRPGHFAP
jgi:hypothetical protein